MRHSRILADVGAALRFYSRIPVPAGPAEDAFAPPDLKRIAYAVPLAGAVIGLAGAAILIGAHALGLPNLVAAILAILTCVLLTGALHEDGLADTADGFGGGASRLRRLEIMRDSRIGSYGACALVFSLLLRVALLDGLLALSPTRAALALIAAASLSRAAGMLLLEFLPPARADGASAAAGQPGADAAVRSALVGALLATLLIVPSTGVGATVMAIGLSVLALFAMTRLSNRLIGGQTGDVAGAVQQLCEIAFLMGVLIYARPH